MPKRKLQEGKPQVNKALEGYEIEIDSFGSIKSNLEISKLNEFLDKNVEDKKLVNRKDEEE